MPGYKKDWHLGLRSSKDQKLLAFISGTPCKLNVSDLTVKTAEINFLCVHRKLRQKRLTPLMIKEVTRRINLCEVWQAIYTSGSIFPTPVAYANYFHRNLNPRKNLETGFSGKPEQWSMAHYVKMNKVMPLDQVPIKGGPRLMTKADYASVYALYKAKMANMKCAFKYTQDELGHQLMPRDGVVYTIVIEHNDKSITDFVSFYNLPSQIL